MEDIRDDIVEKVEEKHELQIEETKSLNEVNVGDIQFKLNTNKSYEEQAEDVVGAMATASAVKDEETAKDIAGKKAEELKAKASKKLKQAQAEELGAEADKQEAERKKNEAVLLTFGITKHLPDWLLKIMVVIFSPIFVLLTIIIGVPCGIVKVLIDNIDNILVRYEKADATNKPKIKVTVWIVLMGLLVCIVAFVVLKATGVI